MRMKYPLDIVGKATLILSVFLLAVWLFSYFTTTGWRFFSQNNQYSWPTDLETVRGGFQFRRDIRPPHSFGVGNGPGFFRGSRPPWTPTVLGFGMSSRTYPWIKGATARRIV